MRLSRHHKTTGKPLRTFPRPIVFRPGNTVSVALKQIGISNAICELKFLNSRSLSVQRYNNLYIVPLLLTVFGFSFLCL